MQASTSLTGQTLANGKYEIAELIGEGGMGTVYRARHVSLRRTVAIKVMHREILSRPKAAARFQREARAASQLNHRNSVQVLDFGEERGMHYIVMEYVDGYDLGDVIRADGALTEERTCRLMVQVCAALARAHDSGVIHRDLKPDNIVITEGHDDDGRATELVKVCDFGIAKIQWGEPGERSDTITEAGDITGTPHFMSPEQCQALEMDARSDIYSCGIILYNMVTGDVPFDAPTPVNIMVMHVAHAPRPPREVRPSVSPEMEAIILQAIAKDPAIRQQDARELRRQLVSHLRHLGAATLDLGTSDTISAQRVAVATAVAGASGLPTAKSPAVVEPAASEPLPAPGGRRMAIFATLFALIGAGAAGMGLYMGSRGGSGGSSAEASHSDPAAQVARPRGARPKTPASVAASVPGPVAEAPAAAPAQPKAEPPEAATAGDSPDDEVATGADASAQDKATAESDDKGQEDEEAAGNPAGGHAAEARSKPAEPARAQAGNAPGSTGGADPVAAAGTSAPEPEPVAQREPSPVGGAAPQAASPTHRTSVPTPTPKPPAAEPADEAAAAAAREPVKTKEAVVVTAAPEVAPAPAPAAAPAAPKPAIPASFEASVSVGGVSASGSLPTSAISSAAERVTSGFASCYEKAARSAGRAPATTVTVRGIIDEDGRGRKFKASGGSLPGLAACVRGVASGIRSRTRPDTGTVDATFDVQFKPKSP